MDPTVCNDLGGKWHLKYSANIMLCSVLLDCVIPENIHIPPTEGHWKFLGGGGGGGG